MIAELSKLEVFAEVAKQLRNKPVNTKYLEKEKQELGMIRKERREEISITTMSNNKCHKSFSL